MLRLIKLLLVLAAASANSIGRLAPMPVTFHHGLLASAARLSSCGAILGGG